MKRIVVFCISLLSVTLLKSQDIDKTDALQLVAKNAAVIGLTKDALNNSIVSNAYFNKTSGIELVYLQQSFQGVPILNQVQTLAFRNGVLISKAGKRISDPVQISNNAVGIPVLSPETAVKTAFRVKNLQIEEKVVPKPITGAKKFEFGNLGSSSENVTAELMWVPVNNGREQSLRLSWQVFLAPKTSPDMWLIRIDAEKNEVINEHNLTIYCNWNKKSSHHHEMDCLIESKKAIDPPTSAQPELSPVIVNGANYRVIPFPAESPTHTGGTNALVSSPWTFAPGNATTLKWHSDGTSDYNYTRGNNAWAYHDRGRLNTPDVTRSAMSTTSPDPLTFNFTPNFSAVPSETSPVQNQQFNITNLFYWTNIVHDVAYQYGFDEVSGNFQANNLGRGGVGNDYIRAEAQDGGNLNNANFSSGPDGSMGRMQMYLFDGPSRGITVNSPTSIAGNYVSVESDFTYVTGVPNRLSLMGPVTGQLVYYNDDLAGTAHEACTAAVNSLTGKIALINRGNCNFVVKIKNAQIAGAIGVIVVNNVAGPPAGMGGADVTITIPAVMISQADGAILAAQLANNVTVTLNVPLDFDGDVDNGVIVHEAAHGISQRLTGGPAQAGCLSNAEQMGEGWSDYYSLMLTQDWKTSNINTGFTTSRGIGTYANGEAPTGAGFRTKRYSTNFNINDLVYAASIPSAVHDRGEIWCATLWDMTWNIIQQVNNITPDIYNATGTGGNVIALKLVTEGMKLQPCNPGFIDGRDAILKADQILYGGQFSCAIREAFRRRGMGPLASQGLSTSVTDQIPDFTPYLNVTLTQNVTQIPEGQNIVYTNRVVSCGPMTNFLLTDTLPLNVTYVSGGSYNAATRVVSFPVTFAAAGSQNFSFTVTVNNGSYYAPTTYLDEQVPTTTFPATLTQSSTTASAWTVSSSLSHSAPYSLFTPDMVGISQQLLTTTNGIPLGTNQSSLAFWHNYDTEAGFDGGVIEISLDNGTSWTDLGNYTTLGYYSGQIDAANAIPISGKRAYTGKSNGFIKTSVNLSSYAGQTAKFRWAFYSDPFEGGPGWYVDDILIKNEAVVNMRSSLFNGSLSRVSFSDTVTLITQTIACVNVAITSQPASTTVCSGSNASFTVAATGTAVSYQWQVSTNGGGTFTNIAGATTATLNLAAVTAGMNNNQYKVIVSNACPSGVTSSVVTLTVTSPSTITLQPANTTTCSGNNASFVITATGTNPTYQWQLSTDNGGTWNNINGATSATLTLTAVTVGMNNNQYRAVISSCAPGGLISSAATLTVNAPVSITTQPVNTVGCTGNNVTFTSVVTGTGLTYQWQISTDAAATWTNIPGATNSSLTLNAVTASMNGNMYRVVLTGTCTPGNVTSNTATLTISNSVTITQHPANSTLCAGLNTSFSTIASGSGLTYQWQVSTNGGSSFTNIAGANTSTLNLTAVTPAMNGNQYRVALNGDCVSNLFTNAATLTVNSSVTIVTQPSNQVGCDPVPAVFSVTATGTSLSYQWETSTNSGATWANIAGATNNTHTIPSLTPALNGSQYRVKVSGVPCGTLTSNAATLTVGQLPAVTLTASTTAISPSSNATLTATPVPAGNYTYQWFRNNVQVAGASTNTLLVNIDNLGIYKAIAASSNGCSNVSNELSITGDISKNLFIFPNPNDGLFHVRFYTDQPSGSARSVRVFDARGARIFTKVYTVVTPYDKMEVNIKEAPGGVYYIEVLDASGKRVASAGITKF